MLLQRSAAFEVPGAAVHSLSAAKPPPSASVLEKSASVLTISASVLVTGSALLTYKDVQAGGHEARRMNLESKKAGGK